MNWHGNGRSIPRDWKQNALPLSDSSCLYQSVHYCDAGLDRLDQLAGLNLKQYHMIVSEMYT